MTSTHVQTTLDYMLMLKRHLGYETEFLHVTHDAITDFDLNRYDIVFQNYCARMCFPGYVSRSFIGALRGFHGLKVLAVQDEYDNTNLLRAAIRDVGYHVVLTCVPKSSIERIYPRAEFPHTRFVSVFTGYVPDGLVASGAPSIPLAQRPIFIGYRGRDIGGRYGRLAFDKFEIGRRMKEECDRRGIATDIAMDEASRIYGTAWYEFIGRCRAMLGSESGSNVFDYDGSIEARYRRMKAAMGRAPSYAEFAPYIRDRELEIEMGQISPRVFECAALRTPMVLFRGRYSDAIEPGEHYIALEKDFSNVDDVLAKLRDIPALEAMVERAHAHLVASGSFSYASYCAKLRMHFEAALRALPACAGAADRPAVRRRWWRSRRTRILEEHPTEQPKTLARFRAKQNLLTAVACLGTRPASIEDLEDAKRRILAIHAATLQSVGRAACEKPDAVSAHLARLEQLVAEIGARRRDYQARLEALSAREREARDAGREDEHCVLAREIDRLTGAWLFAHSRLFSSALGSFDHLYEAVAADCFAAHRAKPGRLAAMLGWQLKRITLFVARTNGSRLALAKEVVRRSPVLLRLVGAIFAMCPARYDLAPIGSILSPWRRGRGQSSGEWGS